MHAGRRKPVAVSRTPGIQAAGSEDTWGPSSPASVDLVEAHRSQCGGGAAEPGTRACTEYVYTACLPSLLLAKPGVMGAVSAVGWAQLAGICFK